MTEMQKFAMETIKEKGGINPNYLASLWNEHKGRGGNCSSRRMFGSTAAAYRTIRSLESKGLIVENKSSRWAHTYILNLKKRHK